MPTVRMFLYVFLVSGKMKVLGGVSVSQFVNFGFVWLFFLGVSFLLLSCEIVRLIVTITRSLVDGIVW